MIRLVQLTDIHISCVWPTIARCWTGKRLVGGLNMILFRRKQLRNEYLPSLVEHILTQNPDVVTVTGDLSTTALDEEFALARRELQPLFEKGWLVTIPGNHDVYTYGSEREGRYQKHFGDCQGEPSEGPGGAEFPFVRHVGNDVVLIGLNTCVPTGLSGAWGIVEEGQLQRLAAALKRHQGACRVVLLHHFLQDSHGQPGSPRRWIRNREAVLDVLETHGAELVLHGHKHACYQYQIPGPNQSKIQVFNPGPSTWHHEVPEMQGGYQIYELEGGQLQRALRYRFDPSSRSFSEHLLWSIAA